MPEPIDDLDFRRATESDVDGMADAHRESILRLGSQFYAPAIVNEWVGIVNPRLYAEAMARGEVFFIATGTVGGDSIILGFSSDYVISGATHGTSAYVRPLGGTPSRRLTPPEVGRVLWPGTRRNRSPD